MSTDDAHTYRMPLPRLVLAQDLGHGPLDGAWWPRCDALELELPSLVALLEPEWGTTVRVTVDAGCFLSYRPGSPPARPPDFWPGQDSKSALKHEIHEIIPDPMIGHAVLLSIQSCSCGVPKGFIL